MGCLILQTQRHVNESFGMENWHCMERCSIFPLSLFVSVSQIVFMETWLGKFTKLVTGSTLIEGALTK